MFHHHLTYMYSWVSAFLPLHTVRASEALSGTDKPQQRRLAETGPRILLSDGSFLDILATWVLDLQQIKEVQSRSTGRDLTAAFSLLHGKN